jgi:uncharacterized membrane protein
MTGTDSISGEDQKKITAAIKHAEKHTSGEIRLFIEDVCKDNVLDRAAFIFNELGMQKTKERNGVLIYLAMESRHFAIIGDSGINSKVKKDFWHDIKLEMQNHFTAGDFLTGLLNGVEMTGKALKEYFPYERSDKNELPDERVFGKRNNAEK